MMFISTSRCLAPCSGRLFGGDLRAEERIGGRSIHAPRPLRVEVAHSYLVVDGIVLASAVQNVPRCRSWPHTRTLAGNAEQIFVQVAAERSPDGVMVAHALVLLFLG